MPRVQLAMCLGGICIPIRISIHIEKENHGLKSALVGEMLVSWRLLLLG